MKNNSQLGLTLSYWLSPQLSLGLLAATPFKHDITLNGATVASTEHLPPTLTLQYQIPGLGQWHPYVGAGINYTAFFGEESRLGTLQLEDSLGLAGELGVDYALNAHWGLNAAMWYLDIDTEAQLNGKPLSDVAIDPWVYQLAVSYRF